MTNTIRALHDDLELIRAVLEGFQNCMPKSDGLAAYRRLKAALTEIEKCEPVVIDSIAAGIINGTRQILPMGTTYYTSPPQRKWISLDFNDIAELIDNKHEFAKDLVNAISEKLKQLNTKG